MVKLTSAHPGLYHPLITNQLRNDLMVLCLNHFGLDILIIGLPANADKATCLADAYSNSFFLGKDTLKGFFGSLTP